MVKSEIFDDLISIVEKKTVTEVTPQDFISIFESIYPFLEEFDISQLAKVETILTYYSVVKKVNKKEWKEADEHYYAIFNSYAYKDYLKVPFLAKYPLCEESLFDLELDFVQFLKQKNRKDELTEYKNILITLNYLSDYISSNTIYIAYIFYFIKKNLVLDIQSLR